MIAIVFFIFCSEVPSSDSFPLFPQKLPPLRQAMPMKIRKEFGSQKLPPLKQAMLA
jgi:hypothetical protein